MDDDKKQMFLLDRIIDIEGDIDDRFASLAVAELLYFDALSGEDIFLLINSPGGHVTSCFAIYDTMRFCKCKIHTICLSRASAIATLLLTAGSKGMRYAFLDSIIEPALYDAQADRDAINDKAFRSILDKLVEILAELTTSDIEDVRMACTINHPLDSVEAVKRGYIDRIIPWKVDKAGPLIASRNFLKSLVATSVHPQTGLS